MSLTSDGCASEVELTIPKYAHAAHSLKNCSLTFNFYLSYYGNIGNQSWSSAQSCDNFTYVYDLLNRLVAPATASL